MAAYASLVCLTNTLDENIQLNLIPQNSQYIGALLDEATFLQDFLEKSSNKSSETAKYLESRIRDAAYKALDIIESHVANRLDDYGFCLASLFEEPEVVFDWDECLFKLMEEINSIKQEVMQIEKNEKEEEGHNDETDLQPRISPPAGSSRSPSHGMTKMVGLDDHLKELKTRLLSGSSRREIVALVGMGGIGKTTLAQNIYNEKYILSHFDICGWATVSQEHNVRNILLSLLDSMEKLTDELRIEHKEKLAEVLYKSLKHRRYLITLDDMWDTQVWDYLKRMLANDENGSRILLTTRLKKVAEYDNDCPLHHLRFLNDEESWGLFCEKAFGHDCCPLELEEIGKEIVRNCRGLPLSINVIGGHLSKATRTPQYWGSVAKNLNETITSKDDDQCSRVLSLSYKYLPYHLKSCFLYMNIFPEDYEIVVSQLVHLWIASGLIKEEKSKSFEDVVDDYFLNLVERNLILVSKRKYNGKNLRCKIHDLIRDLCVKEAKSEKFFHLTDKTFHNYVDSIDDHVDVSPHSRPLRALYLQGKEDILLLPTLGNQLSNMRFLFNVFSYDNGPLLTALQRYKFLYLHTIKVNRQHDSLTLNIWEMPQLRHVKIRFEFTVPDPPAPETNGGNSVIILGKLHTLSRVINLIFTDEVVRRIQNIKKLGVRYVDRNSRDLGLYNLERLSRLESLEIFFFDMTAVVSIHDMSFPNSIKKLTLCASHIPWKDMTVVGSLPNLQVLKLRENAFVGEEWEPNEGEFLNLKTLFLSYLGDLVYWRGEAVHFPMLQYLIICACGKLLEIPSGVGEIPTLQYISVSYCRRSVETSAWEIEEEQHDFGNEGLQVITANCE